MLSCYLTEESSFSKLQKHFLDLMTAKASSLKTWGRACAGPCGVFIFLSSCIQLLGRKSKGKDLTVLQLPLLTAPVHLLDQQCSGAQIMPTLKLLPELEDETSLIKTVFILRCVTAFSLPQVLFCCCDGLFFNLLGFFLT